METPFTPDFSKWSDEKIQELIKTWQQRVEIISNTFFDEDGELIETTSLQSNVVPEYVRREAAARGLPPQANQ